MSTGRRARLALLALGAVALVATRRPPDVWVVEGVAAGPPVTVDAAAAPQRFRVAWSSSALPESCVPSARAVEVLVEARVARTGPDDPDAADVLAWTDGGEEAVVLGSTWVDGPEPEEVATELALEVDGGCEASGCAGWTELGLEAMAATTFEVTWDVTVRVSCEVERSRDVSAEGAVEVEVLPVEEA